MSRIRCGKRPGSACALRPFDKAQGRPEHRRGAASSGRPEQRRGAEPAGQRHASLPSRTTDLFKVALKGSGLRAHAVPTGASRPSRAGWRGTPRPTAGRSPRRSPRTRPSPARLESLLDAAILARVERQDRGAAAGVEAGGQVPKEGVERGQFVVDRHPQREEDAAHRGLAIGLADVRERGCERRRQARPCRSNSRPARAAARRSASRFVGIGQQRGELRRRGARQERATPADPCSGSCACPAGRRP